ncbi:SDR family oxidoreductase [Candidatus Micrarchaeota archaeon]|nr:SDR family oxidoreductase [Candidatus Micrarchaeota archaeon]
MNSVLVTGGAGFIGSNLIETLLVKKYFVICLDNFSSGYEKNIKEFLSHENFVLEKGDVRDGSLVERVIKEHKIEFISHQAARGSVPKSIEEPLVSNEVNVNGTLNVLWAAHKNGVKRVVTAISSSIYGDSLTLPKKEEMPYNPKSPYAITKVTKDMYSKLFHDLYGLETVGLRYFNVYGPKQDPKGAYAAVIPRFVNNALKNEPLMIFGDGTQTRDFTYISDVVAANVLALEQNGAVGKSVNIADGKSTSIKELAEMVIRITDSKSKIRYEKERAGDIKHSVAEVSLAKKYLGYSPQVNIKEGLARTVVWFKRETQ